MSLVDLYGNIPWVNQKYEFILFTSPKAGNTSMRQWFIQSLELPDDQSKKVQKSVQSIRHFTTKVFARQHSNNYPKLVQKAIVNPNYKRLLIVRNPYHRIISGYLDKIVAMKITNRSYKWAGPLQIEICKYNKIKYNPDRKVTFLEFLKYLQSMAKKKRFINEHFRAQSQGKENLELTHVIKLEELEQQLPKFEQQLKFKTNFQYPKLYSTKYSADNKNSIQPMHLKNAHQLNKFKRKTGAFPSKSSFLNSTTIPLINTIYAKDFQLYGYPKLTIL